MFAMELGILFMEKIGKFQLQYLVILQEMNKLNLVYFQKYFSMILQQKMISFSSQSIVMLFNP